MLVKDILMNSTEELIVDRVCEGRNVLIHGPGGVGKSFLLGRICSLLSNKRIFCTATTGIAALNLSEHNLVVRTLHSWSGIGLGLESKEELATKIKEVLIKARNRWLKVEVLVIDEVSMLGGDVFDKLDFIAKFIRNSEKPFGGITLILAGDFLQLAPVKERWLFESEAYSSLNLYPVTLSESKRYGNDDEYFKMLLRVREGNQTKEDIARLNTRIKAYNDMMKIIKTEKLCIIPTVLFPRRISTDNYNLGELSKLTSEEFIFYAEDSYKSKVKGKVVDIKKELTKYKSILSGMLPDVLRLKKGAQVMLKINLDVEGGIVNGSRGVVTDITENTVTVAFLKNKFITFTRTTREWKDKSCIVTRTQFPFILSWALTIHSSQGCSLDSGIGDLEDCFADGQAYVLLSRIRSLKGLFLCAFSPGSIKVNKKALEYVKTLQ